VLSSSASEQNNVAKKPSNCATLEKEGVKRCQAGFLGFFFFFFLVFFPLFEFELWIPPIQIHHILRMPRPREKEFCKVSENDVLN
jgi:hypothetical protein